MVLTLDLIIISTMLLEQVLTILILEEILILMILVMMGIKMEKVLETDLPINTPTHMSVDYTTTKANSMVLFMDDTFKVHSSGIILLQKTQDLNGDGVNDIIEGARNGRTWNYGQLGGFTVDANIGYYLTERLSITNLSNAEVRVCRFTSNQHLV
jgi:iron complex outermembrane receptor protein